MSFGSVLGEIDGNVVATMAAVFSSLPQRVVWKLDTSKWIFDFKNECKKIRFWGFSSPLTLVALNWFLIYFLGQPVRICRPG